jgi:hypothetical protein
MRNAHVLVWSVLMFQAWLSTWQSTERRAAA